MLSMSYVLEQMKAKGRSAQEKWNKFKQVKEKINLSKYVTYC